MLMYLVDLLCPSQQQDTPAEALEVSSDQGLVGQHSTRGMLHAV